jgi:hypothetical protein
MESLTTEFQQWIWNAELDARQSSSNFQSRLWLRGVQPLSGRMETRIVSMSTKHINQFSEHSVPLVLTVLTLKLELAPKPLAVGGADLQLSRGLMLGM